MEWYIRSLQAEVRILRFYREVENKFIQYSVATVLG